MPTLTTVDASWVNAVANDDAELRRFDTTMFLGDGSSNGVRGGIVRHGDNSLAVTVNGSDQIIVQPGAWVIPAATGLGVYRGALQAAVGPSGGTAIATRNATNPRIDLVVVQAPGIVKTIEGTPSASPVAPALPAQHIELARLSVPAVAGGAVTVDSTWRAYATGLGGSLFVELASRLPGSGNQKGQRAVALDTGLEHTWNGTAWIPNGWVTFAPNFPNLPINAGTAVARWRIDNDRTFELRVKATVTGAATGTISLDLPTPASIAFGTGTDTPLDSLVKATNTGTGHTMGYAVLSGTSSVQFLSMAASNAWAATVPHTWKNTDIINVVLSSERA